MNKKMMVAIDGPAGSGKTTISKLVAQRLGYSYIDTGAMYRAITYKTLQEGIDPADEKRITEMAKKCRISFVPQKKDQRVFIDRMDVTEEIRSHPVNEKVSLISSYPGIRQQMVKQQQRLAKNKGVVMEGRDIGTVVLPFAQPKIFLTASPRERAMRRYQEMKKKGLLQGKSLEEIQEAIIKRDAMDSSRDESPLKQALDAIEVNTSNLTIPQVVEVVIDIIHRSFQD